MISISWKKSTFDFIYNRMLKGTYDSNGDPDFVGMSNNPFADKRFTVVPTVLEKQPFVVTSDKKDVVLNIKIQTTHPTVKLSAVQEQSIYMQSLEQTVLLDLSPGYNYIVVVNPTTGDSGYTIINSKYYALCLWLWAQEAYSLHSILTEQSTAIYSKYGSRLAEPLLGRLYPYLPKVKSLQMLAVRLITKTLTGKSSTDLGIAEMASALTSNSPYFSKVHSSSEILDLVRFPLGTYQELFSGKIAHVWLPDFTAVRKRAFLQYINNIAEYSINQVTDDEIIVSKGGELEKHQFTQSEGNYFDIIRRYTIDIYGTAFSKLVINFIQSGYPLDMKVSDTGLGNARPNLDDNTTLDATLPFDADQLDGKFDYTNASLIDRNERADLYNNQVAYDSTANLIYTKGYYTKVFHQGATNINTSFSIFAAGFYIDGVKVDEDDGLLSPPNSGVANFDDGTLTSPNPTVLDDGTF